MKDENKVENVYPSFLYIYFFFFYFLYCHSVLYNEKYYIKIQFYRLARDQSGYNFDFRLLYKVLPRETAVVRFGGIRKEG